MPAGAGTPAPPLWTGVTGTASVLLTGLLLPEKESSLFNIHSLMIGRTPEHRTTKEITWLRR
ncbi:hypothetical protein GCM10010360_26970 [Streptomyces nogalater]